jgi:hypothetical protein
MQQIQQSKHEAARSRGRIAVLVTLSRCGTTLSTSYGASARRDKLSHIYKGVITILMLACCKPLAGSYAVNCFVDLQLAVRFKNRHGNIMHEPCRASGNGS